MLQRKLRQQEEQARLDAIRKRPDVTPEAPAQEAASPLPSVSMIEPETTPAIPKPTQRITVRKRDRLDPRKVRVNGKLFWQVDLGSEVHSDGKRYRKRRTFASVQDAEEFARLKRIERTNKGTASLLLDDRLRGEAVEADRLLKPYGVSILEVARQYVQRRELVTKSETVSKAVASFLTAKAHDGLRARYLEDLRYRLNHFSESFSERKIADLTASELDQWLRGLRHSPASRNLFRQRCYALFEFARLRGWIPANPLKDVQKAKVTGKPPGILSPEQAARLLEAASEETLPIFALGLFAGLRSAELARVQWHHIRWTEGLVEIPARSSKTASRRLVTMQPNLLEWLQPYRDKYGPICLPGYYKQMVEDRCKAGINDWPSNAMRHSFASYHLAAFRDAPALSLELGHTTPQVVFQHYREVVAPSEAERFWRIVPAIEAGHKLTIVA